MPTLLILRNLIGVVCFNTIGLFPKDEMVHSVRLSLRYVSCDRRVVKNMPLRNIIVLCK